MTHNDIHADVDEVERRRVTRRTLLKGGGGAVAGLSMFRAAAPAHASSGRRADVQILPWLDQPQAVPGPAQDVIGNQLVWEQIETWITPNDKFFTINHYGMPTIPADWRLQLDGLLHRPQSFDLAELRRRPRREVDFTLECSGNTGLPFFTGGIGNARWAGTPLAPILQSAGIAEEGTEVVFWGSDSGPVTISDNEAFTEPFKTTEKFARSMSVAEAMDPRNLLCYQMNGVDLPPEHGAPVRLIAPGWYGVANVKWLERIEVRDGRFAGRFMARDYVTVRREGRENGQNVYTFTNVSHDRLKSAPARVTRIDETYIITGAAWGAPIAGVDVSIDHGPWMPARLVDQLPAQGRSRRRSEFAWSFWTFDWGAPPPKEYSITSRAFDINGNVQPAPVDLAHIDPKAPPTTDDLVLASKLTYWESNGQITRRVLIP
jgi:DMSO/TMAO reductase YedYZ molybdopterin-dependent catalytic subunit